MWRDVCRAPSNECSQLEKGAYISYENEADNKVLKYIHKISVSTSKYLFN